MTDCAPVSRISVLGQRQQKAPLTKLARGAFCSVSQACEGDSPTEQPAQVLLKNLQPFYCTTCDSLPAEYWPAMSFNGITLILLALPAVPNC